MITWRPYRRGDEAALRSRHLRQCEALGVRFAFPDLDDPRYVLGEVAERGGQVVGAVVFHATLEAMFLGGDAAMVRAAVGRQCAWSGMLRQLGADEVHAFVPRRALRAMERILRRLGFRRSNEAYVPFYREVTGVD